MCHSPIEGCKSGWASRPPCAILEKVGAKQMSGGLYARRVRARNRVLGRKTEFRLTSHYVSHRGDTTGIKPAAR